MCVSSSSLPPLPAPRVSDLRGGDSPVRWEGGPGGCQSRPAQSGSPPRLLPRKTRPQFLIGQRIPAPPHPSGIKILGGPGPCACNFTDPICAVRYLQQPRLSLFALRSPPLSSPRLAVLRPQPCAAPWLPSPTPAWRGKRSEFV